MANKKKRFIYCNIAVGVLLIALMAAVVWLSIRVWHLESRDYHKMKCESFAVQNTNSAKGQIVFLGDSITDLYVLDDHYRGLQRACYNRGIGGDTTSDVLNRLQMSVLDLAPSTVVLMIGTNDINGNRPEEEILDNYSKIIQTIKTTLPDTKLYCVSVIPQNKQLEQAGVDVERNTETILQINSKIRQLSEGAGAVYIDLFPLLADENNFLLSEYSDDGIHLNVKGLAVWTEQMLPLLQAEEAEGSFD